MQNIGAICVYCGSSDNGPVAHRETAYRFGRELAERGIRLVYGGGRVGIMGALADSVLAAGGHVTGIIPEFLLRHEVGHTDVSRLEVVATMHERKARMAELSDAFVILPGGLGTLEELFEVITWKQLRLHTKPIVVVNAEGYWDRLRALIDGVVAARYARDENARLAEFVADIDGVFAALEAAPPGALEIPAERL